MRYAPNFTQSLPLEQLAKLPRWATYEGDAEDLQHLVGLELETATVEQLVYVGERENIYVTDEVSGDRWQPWKGIYITELDGAGNPVAPVFHEELVDRGANAMSMADLGALGLTDAALANMAKTELGEVYEPDRPGPSDVRRKIFDRVMAKVVG